VGLNVLGLIISSRYVVQLKDERENCQVMNLDYEDAFMGESFMSLYSTHIHHIGSGSPGQAFSCDLNFLLSINTSYRLTNLPDLTLRSRIALTENKLPRSQCFSA
jgi:hypothetical protein